MTLSWAHPKSKSSKFYPGYSAIAQTEIKAKLAKAKKELYDLAVNHVIGNFPNNRNLLKQNEVKKDLPVIIFIKYLTSQDTLLNAQKSEFTEKTSTIFVARLSFCKRCFVECGKSFSLMPRLLPFET